MRLVVITLFALFAFASPAFATSVTNLKVDNTSPSAGAGARTQYLVTFDSSAAGNLAAGSTVDVTFPSGTTFANYGGGSVYDGATRIGNCPTPNGTTRKTTCSIFAALGGTRTAVRLEFNGVTNPSTAATTNAITMATSSDLTPTDSQPYTVSPANRLGAISVVNNSPSAGAGARTQYVFSFATTATSGLASTGTSTIDVTFPTGTSFANYGGGRVYVGTTRGGNCPTPDATTRKTTCTIFAAIAANTTARLELNGITNPSTAADYKLTIATSSDLTATDSQAYTVNPFHPVTSVTAAPGSSAQSATTQYVVTFATSVTGGLAAIGTSTIDVTFPQGTSFGSYAGGSVFDNTTTRVGNCPTPNAATRKTTCTIFAAIAAGTPVRLEFNGVTNPATAGASYTITLSTSSDITSVVSTPYGIAVDTVPPDTTLVNGPPDTTTDPRPTFTFASSEPGSRFECGIDGGAFSSCTSPYTPTTTLTPGAHT